jgi:hypothetical protein
MKPLGQSESAGVRIDADTRAKLTELQKRLLAESSRGPGIEVRRAGIPLGAVVEKALRALERELGQGSSGLFPPSNNAMDPNAAAPKRTEPQNDAQNIPGSKPAESGA